MLSPFTVLYFDVKLRDGILQWVLKNQTRCPLLDTGEFKNLRRLLERTRHIKIELCDLQFSVGSSCHHNSKCGHFTLMFCRGRHGIALKINTHVQHAYFSSFNQWKSSFAALSLPFPLSMLKPLNIKYENFTLKNCTKKRAAHAARLFFIIQPLKSLICGVAVNVAFVIWKLKQGRQQRKRQRQKTMLWLVEWGKITVLHVRHAL